MKNPLLALCLFIIAAVSQAQQLSPAEAVTYAGKLRDKKILNDRGHQFLVNAINSGEIREIPFDHDVKQRKITKSAILMLCQRAFMNEMMYRSGLTSSDKQKRQYSRRMQKAERYALLDTAVYRREVNKIQLKLYQWQERQRKKVVHIEASIKPEDPIPGGWRVLPPFMGMDGITESLVHPSRSTIGSTRTRTAKDLLEIGLIDERVLDELLTGIQDTTIVAEDQLLHHAAVRTTFFEQFETLKAAQLALIDSLASSGVMTWQHRRMLVNDYDVYEIKDALEILSYCNHSLIVDKSNDEKPEEYILSVLDQLEIMIPKFKPANVKVERDTVSDNDFSRVELTASFSIGDQAYRATSILHSLEDDTNIYLEQAANLAVTEVKSLVNKWFADQGAPERLYSVLPKESHDTRIGLILLTKGQSRHWKNDPSLSAEDHSGEFSMKNIRRFISRLDSIGVLNHLTRTQIDSSLAVSGQAEVFGFSDILTHFKNVLYYRDGEIASNDDPYRQECLNFARISRGSFKPTNIIDGFSLRAVKDKRKIPFSFDFHGKRYQTQLDFDNEYTDYGFIDLIRQAMSEQSAVGNFHDFYDHESVVGYIFLTPEQHKSLKSLYPSILK